MKHFILIAVLFAFLAGGLASAAHAAMPDLMCSHQSTDAGNLDNGCADNQTKDKADLEQCQDCCCHHTHVLTKVFPDSPAYFAFKKGIVLEAQESLRTTELSSLYRPPIA